MVSRAAHAHDSSGHIAGDGSAHKAVAVRPDPAATTPELLATTNGPGVGLWMLVLTVLAGLGIVGIAARIAGGTDAASQREWGYVAATVVFMLVAFGGAPMVAIAPTLAKANWVRPVTRIASMFSMAGVVTTLALIPLLLVLPPLVTEGARRRSIWFDAPNYSPHFWAILALAGLAITGLGLFYANALPDFAAMRDHATGWRQRLGKRLARGFIGTENQWRSLRMRIGMMGTLYFLLLIFTHGLIAIDFGISLVPGYRDSIFPMSQALTSLQSGIASTLIAMWIARKFGRLEKYLQRDQFWALGKLLFATSLLWFYFFFSGFIVYWYGRSATDAMVLDLFVRGPFIYVFIGAFVLAFFLPWWLLIWNKLRDSVWGPPLVAVLILFGNFLNEIRFYVAAWSIDPTLIHEKFLTRDQIPQTHFPDVFDIFVMVGLPAAAILMVLIASRLVPVVSIWETRQWLLLSRPIKYMRGHALLVAKPD